MCADPSRTPSTAAAWPRFQALPGSACVRLSATAELSRLLMAQQLGTVVYALRRHPLDLVGQDVAVIGQGSAGAFFTFLLKRAGGARAGLGQVARAAGLRPPAR